jgi:Ca2+/Na+ antiporter
VKNKKLNKKNLVNLIILIVTIIASFLIYFFTGYYLAFLLLLIPLILYLMPLLRRKHSKKQVKLKNSEFVEALSYFRIFYENNENVYNSLVKTSEYTNGEMSAAIKELCDDMLEDTTITPFVTFMNKFENRDVHQVVLTIYQLINYGGDSERLNQFNELYNELKKVEIKASLDKKQSYYSLLNQTPLIATGLLMFTLLIGVFSVIGGYIYG